MRRTREKELLRSDQKRGYWLLKTEPLEWSWEDQLRSAAGVSRWDGVRNRQAQKNLKSMKTGDLCFFYHSGRERRVIGVVEVARTWYSTADDHRSDDWEGAVDVRTVSEMQRAVDLREIKADAAGMKDFALLRQPRLSVVPVPERVWDRICEMGGGFTGEDGEGEDGDDKRELVAEPVGYPDASDLEVERMFRRGRFLSFPMVVGAVLIGVVSGKAIFGPPLDEYWTKKLEEEAAKEANDAGK